MASSVFALLLPPLPSELHATRDITTHALLQTVIVKGYHHGSQAPSRRRGLTTGRVWVAGAHEHTNIKKPSPNSLMEAWIWQDFFAVGTIRTSRRSRQRTHAMPRNSRGRRPQLGPLALALTFAGGGKANSVTQFQPKLFAVKRLAMSRAPAAGTQADQLMYLQLPAVAPLSRRTLVATTAHVRIRSSFARKVPPIAAGRSSTSTVRCICSSSWLNRAA